MAESIAARRVVREHLETHFEEYLSSVSAYLRQAYPEFQLSNEVSEEIAATVIVRVSHANPEPTNIEKALTESADEVIRTRRPRLSQARLLEEVNGPLRSEFPRALPSLRLIQSLSRVPANSDSDAREEGGAFGKQLVLANPPIDLGASLGLGSSGTAEREPAFDSADTVDDADARVTHVNEPRSGLSAEETRRLEQDDDFGPTSGTLHEVNELEDSRIEARVKHAADPTEDDSRPTITRVLAEASFPGPELDGDDEEGAALFGFTPPTSGSSKFSTPPDDVEVRVTEAQRERGPEASLPSDSTITFQLAATGSREPTRLAVQTLDEHSDPFEVPSLRQGLVMDERPEPAPPSPLEPQVAAKLSSVPPTQESIIPPRPIDAPGAMATHEPIAPKVAPQRTRRKASTRAKKTTTKRRAANKPPAKKPATKPRKTEARAARATTSRSKDHAAGRALPESPARYVADDLAVVAMMGFPSNPKRAAKLCVTAMAEELGLDETADLNAFVSAVTLALETLRAAWIDGVPADAHLEWQRVARQATMRAFLASRV